MTIPLADDFASIAAAMRKGGDGEPEKAKPDCHRCDNGGWEMYDLGRGDPHFRICEACGNPENLPCP